MCELPLCFETLNKEMKVSFRASDERLPASFGAVELVRDYKLEERTVSLSADAESGVYVPSEGYTGIKQLTVRLVRENATLRFQNYNQKKIYCTYWDPNAGNYRMFSFLTSSYTITVPINTDITIWLESSGSRVYAASGCVVFGSAPNSGVWAARPTSRTGNIIVN